MLTRRNPRQDGRLSERSYPRPCQGYKPFPDCRRTSGVEQGEECGAGYVSTRGRTIMADTNVSPTSTIEPGLCAAVAVEASPRASKERLEYIAWYSDAKY